MQTFLELLEAKVTRNLTDTYPAAKGEQNFVNKHIKMDILKSFRQKGNDTIFNGKIVKTFDRAKNHFGNDMNQSIVQYDEGVQPEKKHHIFINGKWVGTTSWSKTNKDALHTYKNEHPGTKAAIKVAAHDREDM